MLLAKKICDSGSDSDSKLDFRRGDPRSFPRRGVYVFAPQFFDGSNEETLEMWGNAV